MQTNPSEISSSENGTKTPSLKVGKTFVPKSKKVEGAQLASDTTS